MIAAGKISLEIVGSITEQLQQNIDDKIYDDALQKRVKPAAAGKTLMQMGDLMYS